MWSVQRGKVTAARLLFLVSIAASLGALTLLWTFGEYLHCLGNAIRHQELAREARIAHWLASIVFFCGLASVASIAVARAWAIAGILVLPLLGAAFFSCLSLGFANVTLWSRIDLEIERRRTTDAAG